MYDDNNSPKAKLIVTILSILGADVMMDVDKLLLKN